MFNIVLLTTIYRLKKADEVDCNSEMQFNIWVLIMAYYFSLVVSGESEKILGLFYKPGTVVSLEDLPFPLPYLLFESVKVKYHGVDQIDNHDVLTHTLAFNQRIAKFIETDRVFIPPVVNNDANYRDNYTFTLGASYISTKFDSHTGKYPLVYKHPITLPLSIDTRC